MKRRLFVAVLGLLLAGAVVTTQAGAQDAVCLNAAFGVRAVARLAEAEILGLIHAMHTVAASADLQSGDWERMQGILLQFEESELTYDAWFLQPDGSYYKAKTGLADANLSDRAYFARVMNGEATMDDLVVSRSTGRKSLVLTVPVFQGSAVIGALGVTLYLDDFSSLLDRQLAFPIEVAFYAYQTDSGIICVHPDSDLLLEPLASSGIGMAIGGIQISSALGWTFVLGPPQ